MATDRCRHGSASTDMVFSAVLHIIPCSTWQGNMDPGVLFGSDELIRDTAVSIAQQFVAETNGRRYIAREYTTLTHSSPSIALISRILCRSIAPKLCRLVSIGLSWQVVLSAEGRYDDMVAKALRIPWTRHASDDGAACCRGLRQRGAQRRSAGHLLWATG